MNPQESKSEFACKRCGIPNPRLESPPLDGELGLRIHEAICQACWQDWLRYSLRVINEYRLNLATEQGAEVFDHYLKEFLGLEDRALGEFRDPL